MKMNPEMKKKKIIIVDSTNAGIKNNSGNPKIKILDKIIK